jgi:hypothetical protein
MPAETKDEGASLHIPEFSDSQRFFNGTDYGPFVRAYGLLRSQKLTLTQFNAGWELVGLVLVDTWTQRVDQDYTVGGTDIADGSSPVPGGGSVPLIGSAFPAFGVLGLREGWNCVFFKHTGTNRLSGWKALIQSTIVVPSTGTQCAFSGAPTGKQFPVRGVGSSTNESDYPGAARIISLTRSMYGLGFRCAVAWCDILPTGGSTTAPPHKGVSNFPITVASTIPGWYDAQQVAISRGTTRLRPADNLRPSSATSVVPDTQLAKWKVGDFMEAPRLVGRIAVSGKPEGKYAAKWGLETGMNEIWIQLTSDSNGQAWIRTASGKRTDLRIRRRDHHADIPAGYVLPATGRLAWIDNDDAVWIECDIGCCYIDSR